MKKLYFIFLISAIACTGSLTEEQRKKMKEASEQQSIVKVTEAEITEAAFATGRSVMGELTDIPTVDSVGEKSGAKIHWLQPGSVHGLEIERQLIDAYINSVIEGNPLQDNVQKIGVDSMLYTKAIVVTRPDGSVEVKGTWNIWMSKKQLILSMKKK
jgi:hypothetical protein